MNVATRMSQPHILLQGCSWNICAEVVNTRKSENKQFKFFTATFELEFLGYKFTF